MADRMNAPQRIISEGGAGGPFALPDCARDSIIPGELVETESESAYRRGFSQGASIAVQAMEEGIKLDVIRNWVEITLRDWRREGHPWPRGWTIRAFPPPDPPGMKL